MKVLKSLTQHEAKNKLNAFMLDVSEEEGGARERGDLDAAQALFRRSQEAFHQASNKAKNASLYVDWSDGWFVSPAERISADIAARNETFLGQARNNLETLRGLLAAPEKRRELMLAFVKDAEALRAENPPDRVARMHLLLERFLEDGLAALGTQAPVADESA